MTDVLVVMGIVSAAWCVAAALFTWMWYRWWTQQRAWDERDRDAAQE